MTMAICIKCGSEKLGALSPCRSCRFCPAEAIDQAKSVLLSDHNLLVSELEAASEMLRSGGSVSFDDASLQALTEAFAVTRATFIFGVRKTSWIALGIAILIGLLLGFCFVTIFSVLDL